jgi:hypothetical protein
MTDTESASDRLYAGGIYGVSGIKENTLYLMQIEGASALPNF